MKRHLFKNDSLYALYLQQGGHGLAYQKHGFLLDSAEGCVHPSIHLSDCRLVVEAGTERAWLANAFIGLKESS